MDEETRVELYSWIDEIPLVTPKKDFVRDFSNGYAVAKLIKHFLPSYVQLHNYRSACYGENEKEKNWLKLNKDVFLKYMGFEISNDVIKGIIENDGTIEFFLLELRNRINRELLMKSPRNKRRNGRKDNSRPEAFQLKGSTKGKIIQHSDDTSKHDRYRYLRPDPGIEKISMENLNRRREYPPIVKQKVPITLAETDRVPRILYDEKDRELYELDRKVQEMEEKIRKTENLLRLKDERIQYTEQRIEALKPKGFGQGGFMPQQSQDFGESSFNPGNYMIQQKYE